MTFKSRAPAEKAPVRVPNQRKLAPSVTSVANDKGDNKMVPGAVHRSPGICLSAEENFFYCSVVLLSMEPWAAAEKTLS